MHQALEILKESLASGVREGVFPGGIAALIADGRPPLVAAAGTLGGEAGDAPPDPETIYDLASLTKVVATLPAILVSVQEGRLSLADPVAGILPEVVQGRDRARKESIALIHLLTHTAGLPAWRPYYLAVQGRDGYLRAIAEEPLIGPPGAQVVYSDLGFMLLGFVLERVWDEPLEDVVRRLVLAPLGMRRTSFRPLRSLPRDGRIAPTEAGNHCEREMVLAYVRQRERGLVPAEAFPLAQEKVEEFGWRTGLIVGEAHDGNAHYGLNGVGGHAGLFSTLADLVRYMDVWSAPPDRCGPFLDPMLKALAVRCHTGTLAPRRGLGWEASATGGTLEQAARGCSGGDLVSAEAFGHTGFTGTSVWRDPLRRVTLITLTNRVHPAVREGIFSWRRRHHNAAFWAMKQMVP